MQLNLEQRETVRLIFEKVQTKDELLALLNAIKTSIEKKKDDKPVSLINLGALNFYSNDQLSGQVRYRQFSIKKKSGGERVLSAPAEPLKEIQRYIAILLAALYEPADCVTGFTAQRSIVDNAAAHVNKQFVYNIDLKDFFPSIHLHRVKAVLKLPPFNLTGDREPLAFLIARLCCMSTADNKSVLPQGAPTSPILSNIICQRLDRRLSGLAKRFKVDYTRYADDITFSADRHIFNDPFKKEMRRIIEDQHFTINREKVRMQGRGYRQEVTGLTVNEKVNVSKRYLREVRAMLHNWQKKGYEQAEAVFRAHYQQDKGHVKSEKPVLRNVLDGKLNYLRMVRGENDSIYLRYKSQFEVLESRSPVNVPTDEQSVAQVLANLVKLLSLWESDGLDKARRYGKA